MDGWVDAFEQGSREGVIAIQSGFFFQSLIKNWN
jgi:hypothetical protein